MEYKQERLNRLLSDRKLYGLTNTQEAEVIKLKREILNGE